MHWQRDADFCLAEKKMIMGFTLGKIVHPKI
jgi:hypothetical protein